MGTLSQLLFLDAFFMIVSLQGVNVDAKTWDVFNTRFTARVSSGFLPAPSTAELIAYAVEEHLDASNALAWVQVEIGGEVDLSQYGQIELAGSTVDLINNTYIPTYALGNMEQALANILTTHMLNE